MTLYTIFYFSLFLLACGLYCQFQQWLATRRFRRAYRNYYLRRGR